MFDINKEAFKENCKKIDPDVIVILFYKQIKEKVEERRTTEEVSLTFLICER